MDAVQILKKLISFKSLTPNDAGALDFCASVLPDFTAQRVDRNGVKNLILTRRYGDGAKICFAGHIDVVPAGDGWASDPFIASYKDGFIYGRGAQDMKSGVAAMLSVLSGNGVSGFNGELSLLLTSDEEGDAADGTIAALEYLRQNSILPDYAIIGEPTAQIKAGDTIKIGRRGSINGVLVLHGVQGHAAYPQKCVNPAHILAGVLPKLAAHKFDDGDDSFSPTELVITDIRGGMEVSNVTPQSVKIMFNIRNSPLTTIDDIKSYIDNALSGDGVTYDLSIKQSSKPFITRSKLVEDAICAICVATGISPAISTSGGTSDARFFAEFGVPVVEIGVPNDRIHAIDERVNVADVEKLAQIYKSLIIKLSQNT